MGYENTLVGHYGHFFFNVRKRMEYIQVFNCIHIYESMVWGAMPNVLLLRTGLSVYLKRGSLIYSSKMYGTLTTKAW